MRKITFILASLLTAATALRAQTVATFESLSLAHADTFYTNYTASGTDVGFDDGLAHFPCVYDTSWGGFWEQGFAYSNMTDSVTSGYTNDYSAKTAIGYGGSAQYVVSYCYNPTTAENFSKIHLTGTAIGHPVKGFYVTNNTYAYNSMRDGDVFARKFHNGDWFKLVVQGYYGGVLKSDSVGFYLANFLQPDSNDNYIVNTWEWVNLEPLGKVDSLIFRLSSTDNGSFGMNTPAYFCIDNFTTYETFDTTTPPTSIASHKRSAIKCYPQPANNKLFVELSDSEPVQFTVFDMSGKVVKQQSSTGMQNEINTSELASGMYVLVIADDGKKATIKFIKE